MVSYTTGMSGRGLLIYPPHNDSHQLQPDRAGRVFGGKSAIVPLGLITVAACLPKDWDLELIDCNVEGISDDKIKPADLVFTGAMNIHRNGVLSLIDKAHEFGKPIVVGGPDVLDAPEVYEKADHVLIGEAEVLMENFIYDFQSGRAQRRYEAREKADVTLSPVPRFDLLKMDRYFKPSIQITRGCPFLCEFCSVPARYGKVPRVKTGEQVVRELQTLYDLGYRGGVRCSDDNLIGNTKAIKTVLDEIIRFQIEKSYPFSFLSMLTLNVAEDDSLLSKLRDAGFTSVFFGLETPEKEALGKMRKHQNDRRPMLDAIRKVQSFGIIVHAGFILGNERESPDAANRIIECIDEGILPNVALNLLHAEPHSPLVQRFEKEGRLLWDTAHFKQMDRDVLIALNFIPERERVAILRDYIRIYRAIWNPRRFFWRLCRLALTLDRSKTPSRQNGSFSRATNYSVKIRRAIALIFWLGRQPLALVYFSFAAINVLFRKPDAMDILITGALNYLDEERFAEISIKDAKTIIRFLEKSRGETPLHSTTKKLPIQAISVFSETLYRSLGVIHK